MAKIIIVLCALVAAISAASLSAQPKPLDEVIIVENIEDFIKANPDVTVVPLNKETVPVKARTLGAKTPIRYSMGARNGRDRVVTTGQNSLYYPTLQDVRLQLSYPQSGVGAIVSFVEIIVEQSSGNGNAYVVAGGINQRFIRIVVEARQTTYFIYRAVFYGY